MTVIKTQCGACGFECTITAAAGEGEEKVNVTIESECPSMAAYGASVAELDPMNEFLFSGGEPLALSAAREHLPHPACVVPVAVIKAVEVTAGLTLPKDASINFLS